MILSTVLFLSLLLVYAILMNAVVSTSKQLVSLQDSLVSMQTKITQTEQEIVALKRSVTKDFALLSGTYDVIREDAQRAGVPGA